MRDNTYLTLLGCTGGVVLIAVVSVVTPLITAAAGYFTGWVLANLFTFAGQWIVDGAASLGIKFTLATLPLVGAFLGFVGGFFRAHQSNSNSKS